MHREYVDEGGRAGESERERAERLEKMDQEREAAFFDRVNEIKARHSDGMQRAWAASEKALASSRGFGLDYIADRDPGDEDDATLAFVQGHDLPIQVTNIRINDPEVPYRHRNSRRFHELLELAGELHDKKQADYGKGTDPFANVRSSEDFGIPGWVGALVRLNDKVKRLQKKAAGGNLENEGVYDNLLDIAVYSLISYVLYEEIGEDEEL